MMTRLLRLTAIFAVAGFLGAGMEDGLRAEGGDPTALATALKDATATLQGVLKASEPEGRPISAKFEIEDGKLQLSVYTLKGDDFMEVVADPKTAVAKSEKITDADDLKAAATQKAAMAKATVSLLSAADAAAKANGGLREISIYPQLRDGHPVAEVTLLQGTTFKKVMEKLD
jgi:hypothetical protein